MSLCKKIMTVFLSVIMIVCTLYTYSTVTFAETQYANITGSNVSLRKSASTESEKITSLSKVKVAVNSTVQGEEAEKGHGTTWYNITTTDGKYTGFVYGHYVELIPSEPEPYINLSFDEQLKTFPQSYQTLLKQLHSSYPNWSFIADNIDMTFDRFVNIEFDSLNRKQVPKSNCNAYKSMMNGAFDWNTNTFKETNGGWCSASYQIIAYYVDPRNFLDTKNAFLFLDQGYDKATQTFAGLKAAYSSTFLGNGYDVDGDGTVSEEEKDAYFNDIMAAAEESLVNPYVIASKIAVEQGKGNSRLISGTCEDFGVELKGYYNFLNIGASGNDDNDVVKNGLTRAKENGWDTRRKSITGGAEKYADGYINNGQRTNYYMDFNCVYIKNGSYATHQYAQNVADAVSKASWIQKAYDGNKSTPLVFRIPVFKSMPEKPYAKPAVSDNYNNYYLLEFNVEGLNQAFDKYKYSYSFKTDGDKTVPVKLHGKAKLQKTSYALIKGLNVIYVTVTSETGYSNTYTFSVNSSKAGTLTLTTEQTPLPPQEPVAVRSKGDINGDNAIDVIDLARIRMHMLGVNILTGDEYNSADINDDKAVDVIDLARIRMHMLGINKIS